MPDTKAPEPAPDPIDKLNPPPVGDSDEEKGYAEKVAADTAAQDAAGVTTEKVAATKTTVKKAAESKK